MQYILSTCNKKVIQQIKREKKDRHSVKRDTIEKSRSWGSLSQERISPSGQPHGTSWYGLSNKQTHKSVQKQYTAPTSTLKLYIEVMKNQIYVQTKQNIQTDAMHTRINSINSINRRPKATNFWKYQNATIFRAITMHPPKQSII